MSRQILRAWAALLCVTLGACLIAIGIVLSYRPQYEPTVYTFHLPVMFLGCFHYQAYDGEVMANWYLEQPTQIEVGYYSTVHINGGSFTGCYQEAVFKIGYDVLVVPEHVSIVGPPK